MKTRAKRRRAARHQLPFQLFLLEDEESIRLDAACKLTMIQAREIQEKVLGRPKPLPVKS